MTKRQINFLIKKLLLFTMTWIIPFAMFAQPAEIKLQIDGAKKYQIMDGFGVNINTAWWYNGAYGDAKIVQPAIDLIVDSLGATIIRAVIEEMDWEAVNDNNDPNHFNWTYYNSIFSNSRFKGVWNTLRYLNQKGITDGLIISFMGGAPAAAPLEKPDQQKSWMGGTNNTIAPGMEDELVESIAALLYYMRNTAKIKFHLVSPMNETEQQARTINVDYPNGKVEGPNIPDALQCVRVIKKLAEKLDAISMSDIRFVVPDAATGRLFTECLDEMNKDSYLMSKLACWGVHIYGKDAEKYRKIISKPANPNKSFWVTETARIENMLGELDDNPTAIIFWDGFDCVYQHGRRNGYGTIPPNDYVFPWGEEGKPLLELIASTTSWKPRKQFYEHSQVMKFIKPGALRIGTTYTDSNLVVHAFTNPNGQLVIVGRNKGRSNIRIDGTLINLKAIKRLEMIYTSPDVNIHRNADVIVSDNILKAEIPANCVFTLKEVVNEILSGAVSGKPEPEDRNSGEMHVHRNSREGSLILPGR